MYRELYRPVLFLGSFTVLSFLCVALTHGQNTAKPREKPRRVQPSLVQIEDVAGLPRVLLIGDSISMGYTLPVREALAGKVNVQRPPMNCGPTKTGVASLESWLGDKKWDLIHFNWGLHDMRLIPADEDTDASGALRHQVPLDEYEKNLRRLVATLRRTGAKLIWRNTTPVPEGSAARRPEDVAKYNAIAARIMQENLIPTHDLHSFVVSRQDELMLPQNVHYTPAGYAALATEVAREISRSLDQQ